MAVMECVVNVSEGRDRAVIDAIAGAARAASDGCLLDVHCDSHHNRSVFTMAASAEALEEAVRGLTAEAVRRIDLRAHVGVHPRLGAVDVVPFVPLAGATMADAVAARGRYLAWAAADLGLPCFLYGPERPLPEVRRQAFVSLLPDSGPPVAHPTAGAVCVGARPVLVAYNLWLAPGVDLDAARAVAAGLRSPALRALALDVGRQAQVSCNLVEPETTGPADVYDAVAARVAIERAELVGLAPAAVVEAVPAARWRELDLDPSRTIEARLGNEGG